MGIQAGVGMSHHRNPKAEILHIATEFVLYELNFERCLVLLRSEEAKDFCVRALDGYYDEDARQDVASLSLSVEEPALLPLRLGQAGQVMCTADPRSTASSVRRAGVGASPAGVRGPLSRGTGPGGGPRFARG
jgi:hypothetical protein